MSSVEKALQELRNNPIYKAVLEAASPEQKKVISERAEALVSVLGGVLSKTEKEIVEDKDAAKKVYDDLSVFNEKKQEEDK